MPDSALASSKFPFARNLRQRSNARFFSWLDKRIPASGEITLNQRRIFIFPSRSGLGFLLLVLGLLLGGINYENNMLFSFAFLLLSLFLIAILHTYSNLSGLTVRSIAARPTFAGEHAEFELVLSRVGKRSYEGLQLQWEDSDLVQTSLVSGRQKRVSVFVPAPKRGVLKLGRLLIQTHYPMGLIRAWTWLDFKAKCLVYPRPESSRTELLPVAQACEDGSILQQEGSDDFSGFRDYVPGDSLKQIAWQQLAKGQPMMTRLYQSQADQQIWIDWNDFDNDVLEQRLSRMCYLILYADENSLEYGVRLPGLEFPPALTSLHKLRTLQALALYEQTSPVAD